MTKKLLEWNEDLIKHRSSGSTPLHFAASWDIKRRAGLQGDISRRTELLLDATPLNFAAAALDIDRRAGLLLDAYESSAYQPDNTGSFPIHVAALGNNLAVVHVMLEKCPDCAQLRDAQGRTFLHIAVSKDYYHLVRRSISLLLRGNHLWAANGAFQMRRVYKMLMAAGARFGVRRRGEEAPMLNEEKEAETIKESTTIVGVVSVLILTVSFAAAFQSPGGYSTDANRAGTPELAKMYSFQAFVAANNLATLCSGMSTLSLMYAGVSTVDIRTRGRAFVISVFFLKSSARCLAGAFVFGTYAVLDPVAHGQPNKPLLGRAVAVPGILRSGTASTEDGERLGAELLAEDLEEGAGQRVSRGS
ncbi:ankyrin repeat-containing protein ITN1-like [Panicum virgatum]|uniref:ankyrin repeat-containing protein ITN1-like n=1 Tax=Panicum virgatum TaxID=38727 RepID=UPI0019D5E9CB|nr:ankyrin repeat-containing protein ITN1-like [Panicum virgatum]